MAKNLKNDLDISLKSKVPGGNVGAGEGNKSKTIASGLQRSGEQSNSGFDVIDERMRASSSSKATVATTIRLPEEADKALRQACRDFGTSKADMVKSCIEEYLRAKKYLNSKSDQLL